MGLLLHETGTKVVISTLDDIKEPKLAIQLGVNLVKYEISDVALGNNSQEVPESQALDNKVVIDAATGSVKQVRPDVDPVADLSVSGAGTAKPQGLVSPESQAVADVQCQRVARVKGLPSTFTLPMSPESLALAPLNTVTTLGLPDTFNRIWFVDTVSHDLPAFTTTVKVYSPIEIIKTAEPVQAAQAESQPPGLPGAYIYPVTGFTVTSLRGIRTHPITGGQRMHNGLDIGCPTGTPIIAANAGIVTISGNQSGYGLVVYLKHQDGFETRYAHCSQLLAQVGQQVSRGQRIAISGNTGGSTGAHLHFEVRSSSGASVQMSAVGLREYGVGSTILPNG